ncbi:MAG TPA: IPT/TIG domain-containing protein [Bryobacteraceae bacterium]|nr:IPT/TIG domain-containing protein [Bryobacteraceae bacterium]
MRLSFALPLLLGVSLTVFAQQPMPRMNTVDPPTGRAGDVITVAGENLEKALVAKVYLTDEKNDILLDLTEQTPNSIKFKIPTKASAGRFALMLLTTGKEPKLIEQPVKLTVEQ